LSTSALPGLSIAITDFGNTARNILFEVYRKPLKTVGFLHLLKIYLTTESKKPQVSISLSINVTNLG